MGDSESVRALRDGAATPRALASADFDGDGVPDLACGYSAVGRGAVVLHRGNIDALFPNHAAAQRRRAEGAPVEASFLPPARVFPLSSAPEFLAAGDFDNDGHRDLVAAARSDAVLVLLAGDGHGGFEPERTIPLPGPVTALEVGEINRADGLADLIVGVEGRDGPRVLVFEGPEGALRHPPESMEMPSLARDLLLARVDDDPWYDLVVAAGAELVTVEGRDCPWMPRRVRRWDRREAIGSIWGRPRRRSPGAGSTGNERSGSQR